MEPIRSLVTIQASTPPPVEIENRKSKIENSPESSIDHCLDFLSSDATLDRYHEIIDPTGWRLSTYQKNPVFQNAHNHDNIIHTLGRATITEVRQVAGRPALFQRIHFAVDANPIAKIAYSLYKGGFLNAVSVGFLPIRWEDNVEQASSPAGSGGVSPPVRRRHLEQELLEVSAVSIPANPNALALAYTSGAVEKSTIADTIDLLRHLASHSPHDIDPESKIQNQPPKIISPMSPIRPIPNLQPLITLLRDLRSILKHL